MAKTTPMMQQYHRIKDQNADALLFFRLGDFYEMFGEDALVASKALDITLTTRGKGTAEEVPMCGVPWHSADRYIARLTRQGFKVAICDQIEDASQSKGLVERDVVRVITPGTDLSEGNLDPSENNYLAAVLPEGERFGLAFLDGSTGDFWVAEGVESEASEIVARYGPREVLYPEGSGEAVASLMQMAGCTTATRTSRQPWCFDREISLRKLREHFELGSLEGYGLQDGATAVRAAGAALGYLQETQKTDGGHVSRIRRHDPSRCLLLDETTRRNLELVRSLRENKREGSLLHFLDETVTAMGSRLLRSWLLAPLQDLDQIRQRQEAVSLFLERGRLRDGLREDLKGVSDLERLTARVKMGRANPRDLASLRNSLGRLPDLRDRLEPAEAQYVQALRQAVDPMPEFREKLVRALVEEPPATVREGGILAEGFSADLDELRDIAKGGRKHLAGIEAREREETGIGSLKVRHNKVFGYFLEVSKANLDRVPEGWTRKQTLANAERYVTPELKEVEEKVLGAQDKAIALEESLFRDLVAEAGSRAQRLQRTAQAVAALDVLASFALVADRHDYCLPEVREEPGIHLVAARHPVVEHLLEGERFVPNDVELSPEDRQVALLTGPNMGGKSTYLRQTALVVLMAHVGCCVPAEKAVVGRVDRIFTRVGASDNLAYGQSTFMVEMLETANILNSATPRSLVVLDEIGRGTATFDGLSLAWAVAEHIHESPELGCMTLFATHYHELTDLARILPRVRNLRVAVREWQEKILFLRRVEEGTAQRSYGIHVARLAGMPGQVLTRAKEVLANLERNEWDLEGRPRLAATSDPHHEAPDSPQMELFSATPLPPEVQEILGTDLNATTPIEALNLLQELQQRLRDRKGESPSKLPFEDGDD